MDWFIQLLHSDGFSILAAALDTCFLYLLSLSDLL
jgi:hypothetical protein